MGTSTPDNKLISNEAREETTEREEEEEEKSNKER